MFQENAEIVPWLWRRLSYGMLCHVALVKTDVSKECIASIIRVTRIGELGTVLAVTNNWSSLRRNTVYIIFLHHVILRSVLWLLVTNVGPSLPILATPMTKAIRSSKTSVLTRATQHNIPEDVILHSHRRENLESYTVPWLVHGCFLAVRRLYDCFSRYRVTSHCGIFRRNCSSECLSNSLVSGAMCDMPSGIVCCVRT
jgi:hypothetical protein